MASSIPNMPDAILFVSPVSRFNHIIIPEEHAAAGTIYSYYKNSTCAFRAQFALTHL